LDYAAIAQNVSGDENLFSPKITLDASLFYDIPLGSATLEPRITYSHTDSQYSNLAEHYSNGQPISYYLLPARNLWNGSLTFTTGPWLLQVYGTNLNNDIYVSGTSGPSVYYGNPRQYGLRFNRSF
jgi:iron complex outermembrane receptor protein